MKNPRPDGRRKLEQMIRKHNKNRFFDCGGKEKGAPAIVPPPTKARKEESMRESKRMEKSRKTDIDSTYRIKRLERTCLILSISILLLAVFSIRLLRTVSGIAGTFESLMEQLDFIRQMVDAIRSRNS